MNYEIDFQELKRFWTLIRPKFKNEYCEIRLTDGNKPSEYYSYAKIFLEENPNIISKNYTCFFIQQFSQLTKFLSFNNYYFWKNYKICYGINLRVIKKDGSINGSYKCVKKARFLFFDVDAVEDKKYLIKDFDKEIDDFINNIFLSKILQTSLKNYIIINSGAGRHILFKIPEQNITTPRRNWYKEFVKMLILNVEKKDKFSFFKVDGLYDFTRVFGLPETLNIKRKKKVKLLYYSRDAVENEFYLRSKRKKKMTSKKILKVDLPKISESLEWKLMTHPNLPEGEIHSTLLFSLKLLLKAHDIEDYEELESDMNNVRGSHHNLNPQNGTEGKNYHPGIAINWCKRNTEWCKKNGFEQFI